MLLYFCCWASCSKPNCKHLKWGKISKPWEQNSCPVTFVQEQITALPGHPGPVRTSSITPPSLLGTHEGTAAVGSAPTPQHRHSQAATTSYCSVAIQRGSLRHRGLLPRGFPCPPRWGDQCQPTSPAPGMARISRHVSPWEEMLIFRIFRRYLLEVPEVSKSGQLCSCTQNCRKLCHLHIYIYIIYYLWITMYWNMLVSQYGYKPF